MIHDYNFWIPEFSLRNSDLPFLAAEAAVEISAYTQDRSQEDESVKHLSKLLNDLTIGENPRAKLPDNCVVLAYAISGREKFWEYWKNKTHIDEVLLQTNLVAKELRAFKDLSKTRQKELTDFCVSLSKETAYHHIEYYSRQSRLAA